MEYLNPFPADTHYARSFGPAAPYNSSAQLSFLRLPVQDPEGIQDGELLEYVSDELMAEKRPPRDLLFDLPAVLLLLDRVGSLEVRFEDVDRSAARFDGFGHHTDVWIYGLLVHRIQKTMWEVTDILTWR